MTLTFVSELQLIGGELDSANHSSGCASQTFRVGSAHFGKDFLEANGCVLREGGNIRSR